jgi:hypothetical protein
MREQVQIKLDEEVDRIKKLLIQLSDDEKHEFLDELFERLP